MLLDFYICAELEKRAAWGAAIKMGLGAAKSFLKPSNLKATGKALWKNPATRRMGAHAATNAVTQGALGAVSAEDGQRMKGAFKAGAIGAVTGAYGGARNHMNALNTAKGYVGDGTIGGWAKNTWSNVKQTGVDIGKGFVTNPQPTHPPLQF